MKISRFLHNIWVLITPPLIEWIFSILGGVIVGETFIGFLWIIGAISLFVGFPNFIYGETQNLVNCLTEMIVFIFIIIFIGLITLGYKLKKIWKES